MTTTRPYVLVVDDLADAADGLVTLLGLWGYDATACYCGCEALKAAQARRPAVVVLDIGMAPMDGFTLAARLRELPGGRADDPDRGERSHVRIAPSSWPRTGHRLLPVQAGPSRRWRASCWTG